MRLRIVRPLPPHLEGFPLAHLRFGAAYEINQPLSDLLLVTGYGVPEDGPREDPMALKAVETVNAAGAGEPRVKGRAAPKRVKLKRSTSRPRGSNTR